MKIEIFKAPEETENVVKVSLVQDPDGVAIIAVDDSGMTISIIARLQNNGCLRLYDGINPSLGLRLCGDGYIVIDETPQ